MQRFVRTTMPVLMLLIVTVALVAAPVHASHPTIFGARALGMGGAFTAVVEDASALYWNPAAIGLSPISIHASVGASGIAGIQRLREVLDEDDPTKFLEWEGAERAGVGAVVGANFGFIGVASIVDGDVLVQGSDTKKSGHVEARADIGVGAARDLAGDSGSGLAMRAGLAVRRATAERLTFDVEQGSPSDDTRSSGEGYALDLGVLIKATDMVTIAATARNVVSQMTWKAEGEQPKKESTTMDFRAGIAIDPPLLGGTIAADIASGGEVRYGVEKRLLFNGLAARIGQIHRDSQSWTTAGVGLALGPMKIDVATITPDFKDYGYAVEASLRF